MNQINKENLFKKRYALILAGGDGTRLWPISTTKRPKQYLSLNNNNIMINETIRRIEKIFKYENIFIIINKEQEELAKRYIDNKIPRENIICEPMKKNTAMCIFYSSLYIKQKHGEGIVTILSCDHYIKQEDKLQKNIIEAIKLADDYETLVTIGIKPTYPSTSFGYIKYNYNKEKDYNFVENFKEKPDYNTAVKYIKDENYYWNSGMFIWNINTILNNFQMFLPEIYKYKSQIEDVINNKKETTSLEKIYREVISISIDKGILEKSKDIKMIKSEFEWMDIGNLNDYFNIKEKNIYDNVEIGDVIVINTTLSNIYNADTDNLIVAIGVKSLNIINSNGVILIANKEDMDKLPQILEKIRKEEKFNKYL